MVPAQSTLCRMAPSHMEQTASSSGGNQTNLCHPLTPRTSPPHNATSLSHGRGHLHNLQQGPHFISSFLLTLPLCLACSSPRDAAGISALQLPQLCSVSHPPVPALQGKNTTLYPSFLAHFSTPEHCSHIKYTGTLPITGWLSPTTRM